MADKASAKQHMKAKDIKDEEEYSFPQFLRLPAELRLMIWEYALPEGRTLRICPDEDDEEDDEDDDKDDCPIGVIDTITTLVKKPKVAKTATAAKPARGSNATDNDEDDKEDDDSEGDYEDEDDEESEYEEIEEKVYGKIHRPYNCWEKNRGLDKYGFPKCGGKPFNYPPEILNPGRFLTFPLAAVCQESREFIIDYGYEILYSDCENRLGDDYVGPWFCHGRDDIEEFTEEVIAKFCGRNGKTGQWIFE